MSTAQELLDELDEELSVAFDEPVEQPSHFGLNSRAPGHKWHARWHRAVLHAVAACLGVASLILIVPSPRIGTAVPITMFLGAVVIAVLSEANWQRSMFCQNCDATVRTGILRRRSKWCPGCGNLAFPKDVLPESQAPHELSSGQWLDNPEPYVFFLAQVLGMVIAGRGKRLSFRERSDNLAMIVEEDGTTWEFVEPPKFVAFPSAQLIRALCGVDMNTLGAPQHAKTSFRFGTAVAEATFTFRGHEVDIEFDYTTQQSAA